MEAILLKIYPILVEVLLNRIKYFKSPELDFSFTRDINK